LISPYTGGNLGDAAIIESARKQLLDRFGDAEFILLVLDPVSVREIHGVDTFQLSALRRDFYFTPRSAESSTSQEDSTGFLRYRVRAALKRIGGRIPFALPVYRRLRGGLQEIRAEAGHVLDARRMVRNLDALLIAGGGQFDDVFGGPWGHPYAMFKWVRLAHSQGVPVFMIGVGVDYLRYRLSNWFLRHAMSIARRVSLRDAGSIEVLRKLGIRRELVLCPDLAFGMVNSTGNEKIEATRSAQDFTIGLSPIAFGLPGSWPVAAKESFDRYWREFQALTHSLIKENYSIRFFATDANDYPLAQRLYDQVTSVPTGRERIQLLPPLNLAELITALPNFDAVVASRLHGVLLSHVSRTPVLAVSYLRKVRAQMEDMGHERFCLDFDTFTAPEAQRGLNALLAERGRLVSQLGGVCAGRRRAVDNEFEAVCADLALNS